jgi:predicted GIY-YIG superfamily endonuclease
VSGVPVVYRTYDATGRLLYVGSSANLEQRMANHRNVSWWFRLTQQVVAEPYDDLSSARTAEATAIRTEWPVANLAHKGAGAFYDLSGFTVADLRFIEEWVRCDTRRMVYVTWPVRRWLGARRPALATP